jgi:pilus assembly protein CpaE
VSNILAFVSIKGGVGKTTLALETATALANRFNKKVLLVDANFSAPNIGLYLDLTAGHTLQDVINGTSGHNAIYEAHGVDIIPASMHYGKNVDTGKLKKVLDKYKKRYDFIIVDSSPNYDELRPVIMAADKIFLVTSPDRVTLHTTLKAARVAKEQNTPIAGMVVNRIRNPKHEYNLKEIEAISEIPVVARIIDHKRMAQALNEKKPMTILDENNVVAKEVENFAAALCGVSEKKSLLQRFFPIKEWVSKEKVNRELMRETFYESKP